MNEWETLVSGVVFPIGVAAYLLTKMSSTINALKDTINKQTEVLVRVCEKLDLPKS